MEEPIRCTPYISSLPSLTAQHGWHIRQYSRVSRAANLVFSLSHCQSHAIVSSNSDCCCNTPNGTADQLLSYCTLPDWKCPLVKLLYYVLLRRLSCLRSSTLRCRCHLFLSVVTRHAAHGKVCRSAIVAESYIARDVWVLVMEDRVEIKLVIATFWRKEDSWQPHFVG